MSFQRRILVEMKNMANDPIPDITVNQNTENFREFFISMIGPKDTPYENGKFKLEMYLNENYPMEAPKIRFLTKIYHPNVDKLGRICLDILKDKWSPAIQIRSLLLSIQSLLSDPNYSDPLDASIGQHFVNNRIEAIKIAKETTLKYAI
jgi:ubiquitin-conjugating enzyme E2 N